MYAVAAARPRCLAVATGLTATLWGAVAVLARTLTARPPTTPDEGLVDLCLGALVVAAGWAWLQGMAGVADAWRGATGATHSGVRRLALTACGVVLASALTAPAHAASDGPRSDPPSDPSSDPSSDHSSDPLSGLPLPERAEGPAHPRQRALVVRPGDTLWGLAEHRLPAPATDRQVSDGWHDLYGRNRDVIGPDPDLIRPGQVLRLTKEKR